MPVQLLAAEARATVRDTASADELRDACSALIAGSRHVTLHLDRLAGLEPAVLAAAPTGWGWLFDPRSGTEAERLFDAAFNASLNGGYFFQDPAGRVQQWQVRGSGSQALIEWIGQQRQAGRLPGHDFMGTGLQADAWIAAIAPGMQAQPYLAERLAVLRQFADPGRRLALAELAAEVFADDHMLVELRHVDQLADIYPAGMRADPFRKKAILAFLLVAVFRAARNQSVTWRSLAPMDYQLARILAWQGTIELSPEFHRILRAPDILLPIESELVYHLRAATLVAVEALSSRTGVPSFRVDGALFMGFRQDPAFIAEAPPPMRVNGAWF